METLFFAAEVIMSMPPLVKAPATDASNAAWIEAIRSGLSLA